MMGYVKYKGWKYKIIFCNGTTDILHKKPRLSFKVLGRQIVLLRLPLRPRYGPQSWTGVQPVAERDGLFKQIADTHKLAQRKINEKVESEERKQAEKRARRGARKHLTNANLGTISALEEISNEMSGTAPVNDNIGQAVPPGQSRSIKAGLMTDQVIQISGPRNCHATVNETCSDASLGHSIYTVTLSK